MDHAVTALETGQPELIETLGLRRFKRIKPGGIDCLLCELSALEADQVWAFLKEAEETGQVLEAYVQIVVRGLTDANGNRLYSVEEAKRLPARLVVEWAGEIMELTELGLDLGKEPAGGEDETPS